MGGGYRILAHFAELFAAKSGISTYVVIYAVSGVLIPIVLVLYALLSYHVLFADAKQLKKRYEWLRFLWISLTVLVTVLLLMFIIYSCL